jgi:hypothetical protein
MVHYLRNEKNNTIIECETIKKLGEDNDLHSNIDVAEYSDLLYFNQNKFYEIKWDFDILHNIRREWFEGFPESSMDDFVKYHYSRIANKYNLNYMTD